MEAESTFFNSLLAGGSAGTAVDLALFPLDTVKTRLQSSSGFWKSGGFRGIYAGVGSAALGSAPNAALFFCTYEAVKKYAGRDSSLVHMAAASAGEVVACVVRVPVEVVKQRAQASAGLGSGQVLRQTLGQEGFRGLYRGYFSTVVREIPFSFIQFPLWEMMKTAWSQRQGRYVDAWQSGVCGAVSGGIAAALTTPLDVAKTRIMLADKGTEMASGDVLRTLRIIWSDGGVRGLFAGVVPRVMWISVGGAIFLGVYEKVKIWLSSPRGDQSVH